MAARKKRDSPESTHLLTTPFLTHKGSLVSEFPSGPHATVAMMASWVLPWASTMTSKTNKAPLDRPTLDVAANCCSCLPTSEDMPAGQGPRKSAISMRVLKFALMQKHLANRPPRTINSPSRSIKADCAPRESKRLACEATSNRREKDCHAATFAGEKDQTRR